MDGGAAGGTGAENWYDKPVIISAVIPCDECDVCKRGRGTICRNQKMPGNYIHGGFASHITVPANGLCEVDMTRLAARGMELGDLSVVADAVTTPYQAAVQAEVTPGSLAIVIGVGGVGGFAKENGLPMTEWFIFECSGTAAGQETAFGLLVHGATLSVVGFTMDKLKLRLSNLMAFHARALGNWDCTPDLNPGALDLVLDGKVQVLPFVERHPLDDINRIFEAAHGHELKRRAILVPQHG